MFPTRGYINPMTVTMLKKYQLKYSDFRLTIKG